MTAAIILASASPFRKQLLAGAGVDVTVARARIDERAVEAPLKSTSATPGDVAQVLAEAKAMDVSERYAGALVIGADQILSFCGEILHKPKDMEEARRRLLMLSGQTHELNSALAIVRNGETVWRHVEVARLTMRKLEPAFVGRHLARAGAGVLQSVGAYQIEGEGIQLFDRIKGDYFAIIGLPLLPLLGKLRDLGAIDG